MSGGATQATSNAMNSFAVGPWPAKARAGRWAWRFCSAAVSPLGSRPGRPALLRPRHRPQPPGLSASTGSSACSPPWRLLACGRGEEL